MLPGNSISNKVWIEEVRNQVGDVFDEMRILYYDHWQNAGEMIDFEAERKKLAELVAGWNEYLIFAKSVGTQLVLAGTRDGILKPKGALFCGFPRSFADQIGYTTVDDDWNKVDYPVILLQNESDPVGGYAEMAEYLDKIRPEVKLIKTSGNTHDYLDFELIKGKLVALKNEGL